MCFNKKNRTDSLICLTNPQISHRWGSEVRNSPLVANATPRRVEALFCNTARELSQCYINCTVRKAFKESMRDRSLYVKNLCADKGRHHPTVYSLIYLRMRSSMACRFSTSASPSEAVCSVVSDSIE